jgi:hypothetical protein
MFLSTRSHLLMVELFNTQRAATIANHALFIRQSVTPPRAPTPTAPPDPNLRWHKRWRQIWLSGAIYSTDSLAAHLQSLDWNGLGLAHPILHTGLCPHPGLPAHQAMHALPNQGSSSTFDTQAFMAALNNTTVAPQLNSEWYVDSGASSHMSGTLSPTLQSIHPYPYSSSITIGNGAHLPITHTTSSIPTNYHSLLLHNILLSPDLVENLISVCKLTCDNLVFVEFDPFGFSIKDLQIKMVML